MIKIPICGSKTNDAEFDESMYGKVSVIIPNYNCEKFIGETITSVINQTYTDWELLIVDDCSPDNSVEVINRFCESDPRIKLFVNDKNSGAAASRNRAMREASGKWIAFLDSDDLWLPDKLEKQLEFMVKNDYKFSYTYYEHIDEENNPLQVVVKGPKVISKHKMFNYCYVGCLTVIYDGSEINVVQIPDEIANGENDYAIWLKVAKYYKCYCLREILSQYRVRNNSLSHGGSKLRLIKNHYKLFRISEQRSSLGAFLAMSRNLFFGFWKKIIYVNKIKAGEVEND